MIVPANCTNCLQPLDLSVNKAAKHFLRDQFQDWYARQISSAVQNNTEMKPVDLKLSIVKPLGAQWMIKLYNHLKSHPEIIQNGFRAAGITECLKNDS